MKFFDFTPNMIEPQKVLRALGYGLSTNPSPEVDNIINRLIAEANKIRGIKGAYTISPITECSQNGLVTDSGRIESNTLAAIVRSGQSTQLAFGLVTAGPAIDAKVSQCEDLTTSCIWDALGTAICENAVERLLAIIAKQTGEQVSMPFSPGYCDWKLSGQSVVFKAVDPAIIDITYFPDSFMMAPQKSVSFVACLGDTRLQKNPCRYCQLKSCLMRRS